MTIPWHDLAGLAGCLIGARLQLPTQELKPIIGLLAFAISLALLLILSILPTAYEVPVFLLIGIAIGIGVRLLSAKDGYLVRGNNPEEELI